MEHVSSKLVHFSTFLPSHVPVITNLCILFVLTKIYKIINVNIMSCHNITIHGIYESKEKSENERYRLSICHYGYADRGGALHTGEKGLTLTV